MNTVIINISLFSPTRAPLPHHRIEAWDYDGKKQDDFLAEAITNKNGQCQIRFHSDRFNERGEQRPDVYFKVFREEELIYNSKDAVIYWGLNIEELDVVLRVPEIKFIQDSIHKELHQEKIVI